MKDMMKTLYALGLIACLASPAFAQSPVYAAVDAPASMPAVGGMFAGWAINCASQQQPTVLQIFHSYVLDLHDGYGPQPHMEYLPTFIAWRAYRPDVSAAIGTNCGGIPVMGVSPWVGWYAWPTGPLAAGTQHAFIAVLYDADYGYNAGLGDPPYAVSVAHITVTN